MNAPHPTLGSLLGAIRARNGWTLKEMSQKTDIPVSTLSKVEHDRLTLTYDKLLLVSQRLDLSLSELLSDPARPVSVEAPVTARRSIGLVWPMLSGQHAQLRLLLLVPGVAPQTDDPRVARIRARVSRNSVSSSPLR